MGSPSRSIYSQDMTGGMRSRLRTAAAVGALSVLGALSSACMGYPVGGAMATPPPPDQSAPSRLPQLLSQLQQGNSGLELFDAQTPTSDVLGVQDQGKVSGTPVTGSAAGVNPTPTSAAPNNTPRPGGTAAPQPASTPTGGQTATATPAGTLTPAPSATATPTSTPTPTPANTPTPTPTLPPPPPEATPTASRPPTER